MDEGENWHERKNLPQTSREPVPASTPRHGAGAVSAGKNDVLAVVLPRCWCPSCWRGMGSAGRPVSKGLFKSRTMLEGPWDHFCFSSSASVRARDPPNATIRCCFHLLDLWCQIFHSPPPPSVVLVPLPLRFNLPMLFSSPSPF